MVRDEVTVRDGSGQHWAKTATSPDYLTAARAGPSDRGIPLLEIQLSPDDLEFFDPRFDLGPAAAQSASMTEPDKAALDDAIIFAKSHAVGIERRAFDLFDHVFGIITG
jgi:hypothetical protein